MTPTRRALAARLIRASDRVRPLGLLFKEAETLSDLLIEAAAAVLVGDTEPRRVPLREVPRG